MRLTVRLFAAFRERAGRSEVELDVPEGVSVADVCAAVVEAVPALAPAIGAARPVVNQEFAAPTQAVRPGDDFALLPPVSGGALPDRLT